MDADAREQLDQIGGDLNFRYIGPNRIPDLLENPESVDKGMDFTHERGNSYHSHQRCCTANVDEEELEVLRQFKVITFDGTFAHHHNLVQWFMLEFFSR